MVPSHRLDHFAEDTRAALARRSQAARINALLDEAELIGQMRIRPPRYRVWRGSHLALSVVVVVVARVIELPPAEGESVWPTIVAFVQEYGWWVILLGVFAGEGGIIWIESKESTTVTKALNAILGEFRDELFGDAGGQEGDHPVTLFQYRKTCWRAIWQRARAPWGGWLVPVSRPGRASQRSHSVFRTPDHPNKLEGIAGKAWGANSKAYEALGLPDLSEVGNPKGDALVEEYAKRSFVSPGWVRRRVKKQKLLARSIIGFTVEQPDGTAWGVLVVDSKDPHINGERIAKEFRDLWKKSLRHMVAEL